MSGKAIKVQECEFGETPVAPDVPQKIDTADKTYTFSRWFPEITMVTSDANYAALYDVSDRLYTVVFMAPDQMSKILKYTYMETPVPPELPEVLEKADGRYVFMGWDPAIVPVTSDTMYKAIYEKVGGNVIQFVDYDGEVLSVQYIADGQMPVPPREPTRESTDEYDYVFAGWDPEVVPANGDQTYTATYTQLQRLYQVVYMSEGEIYASFDLPMGAEVVVPRGEPEKEKDQFEYKFFQWDGYTEGMTVTGPMEFDAEYAAIVLDPVLNDNGVFVYALPTRAAYFPTESLRTIVDAAKDSPDVTLSMDLDGSGFTFPARSMSSLGTDATFLYAIPVESEDQKEAYEVSFGDNAVFGTGVAVTIPYQLQPGENQNYLEVIGILATGEEVELRCVYADGYVTFTTEAFGLFYVKDMEPGQTRISVSESSDGILTICLDRAGATIPKGNIVVNVGNTYKENGKVVNSNIRLTFTDYKGGSDHYEMSIDVKEKLEAQIEKIYHVQREGLKINTVTVFFGDCTPVAVSFLTPPKAKNLDEGMYMSYDTDGKILLQVPGDSGEDVKLNVSYVASKPNGGIVMKTEQVSGEYDSFRDLYVFDTPDYEDSYNGKYTVYGSCGSDESVRLIYRA
jgi:hypothetical protein